MTQHWFHAQSIGAITKPGPTRVALEILGAGVQNKGAPWSKYSKDMTKEIRENKSFAWLTGETSERANFESIYLIDLLMKKKI